MKWFFGGGRGRSRGCGAAAAEVAAAAPQPRLDPRLKKTGLFSRFGLRGKFWKFLDFLNLCFYARLDLHVLRLIAPELLKFRAKGFEDSARKLR